MAKTYVEEFLFRGRDKANEPKMQSAYHIVLAKWVTGPTGEKAIQRAQPMDAAQATAAGYPISRILGEVAAQALADRDAALLARADADRLRSEASSAAKSAIDERDEALKQRDEAINMREAMRTRLASIKYVPPVESKTLLNKLSLGLLK